MTRRTTVVNVREWIVLCIDINDLEHFGGKAVMKDFCDFSSLEVSFRVVEALLVQ